MLKGNDFIGMPVVAYDTGEQIKKVKDLIFDGNSNFLGFLVAENIWLKTAQVLPLHGIKVIGTDVIIASSQSVIVKADQVPEIREVLARNIVLSGTKIVTEEGRDLGNIIDLYFNKQTGAIEGYEVFGGLFADSYSGRSFVPAPQNLKIGDDVAFVPRAIAEMMEERVISVSEALKVVAENNPVVNHKNTVSPTPATNIYEQEALPAVSFTNASNTPDKQVVTQGTFVVAPRQQLTPQILEQSYQAAGSPSQTIGGQQQEIQQTASEIQNPVTLHTVEQTLGRRVRQAVKTPEGLYVAALGQIVTDKVISRTQAYDKEQELMAAVCLNQSSPDDYLQVRNQRFHERILSAKKARRGLGERIKDTISNFQERSAIIAEVWRIKRVVGHSANRVILDKQDKVILDVGELITYQVIEKARQANVLNILLSSVSRSDILKKHHFIEK